MLPVEVGLQLVVIVLLLLRVRLSLGYLKLRMLRLDQTLARVILSPNLIEIEGSSSLAEFLMNSP